MKLGNLKTFEATIEILSGQDDLEIAGLTDTKDLAPKHLLFIKNKKFLTEWLDKKVSKNTGLVVEKKYYDSLDADTKSLLEKEAFFLATVANVNLAISHLSKPFYDQKMGNPNEVVDGRQMGSATVDSSAWIAQGVFIGENVTIKANVKLHSGVVVLSGAMIDEGTEIFPNVVIYRNVQIGKHVRIHANTTVGSDGFGYNFENGVHQKVWHMGSVIIHDHVEIGANCSIDGGTFSPTIIGAGSKLDNQVQIGHNCRLGRGVIMCGKAGIAGSTTVGDFVVMGGSANVADQLTIGAQAQIAGMAGVINDVESKAVVGGFPARNIKEWLKGVAFVRKMSLAKE